MYHLSLDTLAQVLTTHGSTGRVEAKVPDGMKQLPQARHIILKVERGYVMACWLLDQAGTVILQGQAAWRQIEGQGVLPWQLSLELPLPASVRPAHEVMGSERGARVPRRLYAFPSTQWTRQQQQVFALVDGRRSLREIAQLVSLDHATVAALLAHFHTQGALIWTDEQSLS